MGVLLTLYNHHDSLADGRRDSVGCDAEIGPHMLPLNLGYVESGAAGARRCDKNMTRVVARLAENLLTVWSPT
jgi:hypothetical protein